ncbi:MAG: hypothetical protein HGA45_44875, partial [Chloroflexales bacterium]|nr:hypothetical protein [Chloroflexales bacterium]
MRVSLRLAQLLLGVALLLPLAQIGALTRTASAASTFQVSGTIAGQAGVAIAGATVAALAAGGATVASATSASDGRYALAVEAGVYDIQVSPPAGSPYQVSTLRDRTISADTAIDIALVSASAVTLRGKVLDARGQGIGKQEITVGNLSQYTDATGAYTFTLSPGT